MNSYRRYYIAAVTALIGIIFMAGMYVHSWVTMLTAITWCVLFACIAILCLFTGAERQHSTDTYDEDWWEDETHV